MHVKVLNSTACALWLRFSEQFSIVAISGHCYCKTDCVIINPTAIRKSHGASLALALLTKT